MKIGLQAWGSEGDIAPFLALATGLVEKGHIVTLVVTDNVGRDYTQHAREAGFELVSVPMPLPADGSDLDDIWRRIIQIGNPLKQVELVLRYGYDPVAEKMLTAATDLVVSSDIVVGHFFAYPLQIAAELAGKPAVTLAIVHNCVPTRTHQAPGLPDWGTWSYALGWRLAGAIVNRVFLPRYNGQRQRAGLPPVNDTMSEAWTSKRLNLLAVSPSICQRPSDWPSQHVVTGFINAVKPTLELPLPVPLKTFVHDGEPPIFIGFGSMMLASAIEYAKETVQIWLDAVRQLGKRAVIQLPEALLHLVPNDRHFLAFAWADYRQLFPCCSVIVHHGGAGTTQSALRAGRPAIIVAHVSDQFFWGEELERLGVAGPTLQRKGLNSSKLSSAITKTLANPDQAHRAKALGESISKENGVAVAIEAIEDCYQSARYE
ncbi:glycosyltransferase [Aquitalea palustris]|uniref:Glycosyltransferase n=1 Tax=Aquitalea palustris TaxID=2480983 RepID=A0A454JD89_9NEIS|nr:nucleotide disphospho-sugar-binding domain-containing protein [Aquitalea palustris]RMC91335.1 glycosyltransferase [Aquitalea palustris]